MQTYTEVEIPTGTLSLAENGNYITCDVNSSMVKEWSYLTESNSLFVTFNNGASYMYSKVPMTTVVSLIACSSIGKTINELVKKGGYKYEKLDN